MFVLLKGKNVEPDPVSDDDEENANSEDSEERESDEKTENEASEDEIGGHEGPFTDVDLAEECSNDNNTAIE